MKESGLGRLRQERSNRFWQRMVPELRLAGNYLPGFLIAGVAALFLYDRFLERLAPAPWIVPACALLLGAAACSVRVRTYVEPADAVFLAPAEKALDGYFLRSLMTAWPGQLVIMIAAALAVWPLFRIRGTMEFSDYPALIADLLFLKTANLLLWWREQQMARERTRRLFAFLRFLASCLAAYAGLRFGVAYGLLAAGLAALALFAAGHRVPGFAIHWERLIRLERQALGTWRRFLGQIVELEGGEERAIRNPLARLAGRIRHAPERAFLYLNVLLWLRSPLFGLSLRLIGVGILIGAAAGGLIVKAGIGALFAAALHLQLKELEQGAQEDGRLVLLPLPGQARLSAAGKLRRTIWLAGTILLFAPAAISLVA